MYSILRPLLFKLDPEKAHHLALSALKYIPQFCFKKETGTPLEAMGLTFPHPVGLAAGLDKNGEYLDALAKLGFAFIELGTVTPRPQEGNPKPRLFRLPEASALINRMGFNNKGVDALVSYVKKAQYKGILGINIGKNKDTSLNEAAEDYKYCLQKVYAFASYVTVNISSPNTPELRLLQQGVYLEQLLSQLRMEQIRLEDVHQRHVPLLVKISPDEKEETLKQMTEILLKNKVEGIIATNTTCSRDLVSHLPYGTEVGGLSGAPLKDLSLHCLQVIKHYVGNAVTLVGVGGIDSADSALKKMKAGADLVQIYSGLIYKGPGLVSSVARGLTV